MQHWYMNSSVLALAWMGVMVLVVASVHYGWREYRTQRTRANYKALVLHFSGDYGVKFNAEDVARDVLSFVLRLLMPEKVRKSVELRLSMAGHTGSKPLWRFQIAKLVLLIAGPVIAIPAVPAEIMSLPVAIVFVVVLFFAPDIWLSRQISSRTKRIGYQLPEALDLLQLCVRAGLGFTSGLQEVARVQKGAVSAEFSRVLQEMQFGMSRIDAFQALGERTKQPDLIRFAHAMVRADQAGITVSDMLQEQARSMREARQTLAREKAQEVSVKILFPLLVCFLPGVFIVVLGPAVLNAMTTLSGQ